MSSDQAWLQWIEVQKSAARHLREKDPEAARAAIDRFLDEATAPDLQSDALAFRSSVHEQEGDLDSALEDLAAALEVTVGGYQQYSLELALGRLKEETGDLEAAARWYLAALATAGQDGATATGTALLRLLRIRDEKDLSPEERRLAETGARLSWELLELEGEPDLARLDQTAALLVKAQGRPIPDEERQ